MSFLVFMVPIVIVCVLLVNNSVEYSLHALIYAGLSIGDELGGRCAFYCSLGYRGFSNLG